MAKNIIQKNVENLNMIISVAYGSILEHKQRSEIAKQYSVNIPAVLVPIGDTFLRQTGTEISPGSALEVNGNKENVLKLYVAANTIKP